MTNLNKIFVIVVVLVLKGSGRKVEGTPYQVSPFYPLYELGEENRSDYPTLIPTVLD